MQAGLLHPMSPAPSRGRGSLGLLAHISALWGLDRRSGPRRAILKLSARTTGQPCVEIKNVPCSVALASVIIE